MRKGKNIHKRKDGRWEARSVIGRDARGRLRYKYLYGRTYREAAEKKAEFERNFTHSPCGVPEKEPFPFEEVSVLWIADSKGRWKRSTQARYLECLQRRLIPCWGSRPITELGQEEYDALMEECSGELNANSIQTVNTVLSGIIKFSLRQGYLTETPFYMDNPGCRGYRGDLEILGADEIRRITGYCQCAPDRKKLGILIALYEGVRIGELCALQWRDIDLDERVIHVRQTLERVKNLNRTEGEPKTVLHLDLPKNGRKRAIPIHPELVRLLGKLGAVSDRNHYVLRDGRPYEPRTFTSYFKEVLADIRIRDVRFHALRHTFASMCVENGVDIKVLSEIMGHSSVKITMDRYVHLTMRFKQEQLANLRMPAAFD